MSDRRQHWESIWSSRDPTSLSWYQPAAELSLQLVMRTTPDRTAPVIDVGGGASPLAGQLIEHGYRDVTVLDISEAAVHAGQHRLGATAAKVQWVVADVTRHDFDRTYALWHDRAVLHFLTEDSEATRYVHQLTRAVRPGGHAVIATFGEDGPTSCSGLDVHRYDPAALADLLAGRFDRVEFDHERHRTPGGSSQQFLYGTFRRTWTPATPARGRSVSEVRSSLAT